MRRSAILLAAISSLLAIPARAAPAAAQHEDQRAPSHRLALQAAADALEADLAERDVPGTILVALDRDGVLLEEGYGYADVEEEAAVDPRSTIFRVASVSKTFTALAALQEVERGGLSLERDIGADLPDGFLDRRVAGDLTLHHLLTHTAGLDRRSYGSRAASPAAVEPLGRHLAHALPPVVRTPGGAFVYDNYGYTLAGHLVEQSSGEDFGAHVARTIFEPLGMTRSSFDLLGQASDLATGYVEGRAIGPEPSHTAPAGRMTTTGADMTRFLTALLREGRIEGRQVLSARVLRRMMQPQHRNAPGLPTAYGYGLWIHERDGGTPRSLRHSGDMRGWSARFEILPDEGLAFFLASNDAEGAGAHAAFAQTLIARLATAPEAEAEGTGPFEPLSDHGAYVGDYLYGGVPSFTFDRFFTLMEGAEEVRLGPEGLLLVDGDPYVEVRPAHFRRLREAAPRLAFAADPLMGGVSLRTASRTYFRSTDPVPPRTQRSAFLLALGVMALSVVYWAAQGLRSIRRGRPPGRPGVRAWAALCALSFLAFLLGMAITTATGSLESGVPATVRAALVLATFGAILALCLPGLCAHAFAHAELSAWRKLHLSVFSLAALTATLVCWHWNAIGLRF